MTCRHRVGDPRLHPTNSTNDVGRDVRSHRRDGAGGCRPRQEGTNRRAANNHLAVGSPAAARAETHLGPSRPGADAVAAHVVTTLRLDGLGKRTGPELSWLGQPPHVAAGLRPFSDSLPMTGSTRDL